MSSVRRIRLFRAAKLSGFFCLLGCLMPVFAQVPQTCIQLPERTEVCAHQLYKRANFGIAALNIIEGQMVCICMADFNNLRVAQTQGLASVDQKVELSRSAKQLGISETALLELIRK